MKRGESMNRYYNFLNRRKKETNSLPKNIILWGGTGQAKLNRSIIEYYGSKVDAVFDDTRVLKSPFNDVEIYCGHSEFERWCRYKKVEEIGFSVAIGNPHGRIRLDLHEMLEKKGFRPTILVHPNSFIAENASIGEGSQIMAGAIIAPEVQIGKECIINANSSIDHECKLGDAVEIAPGATLCGEISVGINAWIGAGATILPKIKIGEDAIVGAGAVVTKDVPASVVVMGVPARIVLKR